MSTLEIPHLTTTEAFSGIFGSISLAAWIIVLVPQLAQNYINSSADSISLAFLCIWFVGDVANLSGAIWARLVPTVTALATYFCFADAVLIAQCVYYRVKNRRPTKDAKGKAVGRQREQQEEEEDDEERPLLSRVNSATSASNIGLPGSHRRRRTASTTSTSASISKPLKARRESLLAKILDESEQPPPRGVAARKAWMKNIGSILVICAVGTAGWALAYKVGAWKPAPLDDVNVGNNTGGADVGAERQTPIGAEVLGYLSALAYLGARVPQIIKNWREKSCEGLSLLFFLLSLLGNLTYGAGILFHSTRKPYILTNLPWLIGSLGTMVEDVTIFVQFHMYGEKDDVADGVDEDDAVRSRRRRREEDDEAVVA